MQERQLLTEKDVGDVDRPPRSEAGSCSKISLSFTEI